MKHLVVTDPNWCFGHSAWSQCDTWSARSCMSTQTHTRLPI